MTPSAFFSCAVYHSFWHVLFITHRKLMNKRVNFGYRNLNETGSLDKSAN